ncbi:hypothetical protein PHMEG_00036158 [Phytophthora megakarya]|uniref:Reverse transcriptase n=1 Tax=Phytophthora megakarya TaxID=4795 RepID=A0A225UMF8_9STRA|nr:hypothetical protein PHMEG_00036158 [Phytophthora megakarya]
MTGKAVENDPPAKVPPLDIRLKKGATPCRCKPRQYPPRLREFLKEFNDELVHLGWVFENPPSRWACPALPAHKPGKENYRQTNDYQPVNALTEPIAGVMPVLHVITENVQGMVFFGLFDFIKGFWQLPLAKTCREILICQSLHSRKIWWCGKITNGEGVWHDPDGINILREVPMPTTAGEIQQFLCACNRRKEKKRAANKIAVKHTAEEQNFFERVKDCLASSALLVHTSPNGVLFHCLSGTFTGSQENLSVIERRLCYCGSM